MNTGKIYDCLIKYFWIVGVLFIFIGVYRLISNNALGSYRLLEFGLLLVLANFLLRKHSNFNFDKIRLIWFFLIIIAVSFLFRVFTVLYHSGPVGYDVPFYLSATENDKILEPLFFWISKPFSQVFGSIQIVYILVPLISALTVIPFFFLAQRFFGRNVAVIATIILTLAPLQLRFSADLFRNVIANFFLLTSLCFITNKTKRITVLTVVSISLLALSHIMTFTLFVLTGLIYYILQRNVSDIKKFILLVFISCIPLVIWALPSLYTYEGMITDYMNPYTNTPELVRVIIWTQTIFLFSLPMIITNIKTREWKSFDMIFLLSSLILTTIGIFFIGLADRWLYFIEFPLIILASRTVAEKNKWMISLFILFVIIDSITFGTVLLQSYT
ncbi:MAG: glycosyltransferase family 39 protein [Candidatus Aenigmarchaeota archaeon]|nr:glycosyltransferase family 39 protein [Candidatus Aenigmarchaeota archaeon]